VSLDPTSFFTPVLPAILKPNDHHRVPNLFVEQHFYLSHHQSGIVFNKAPSPRRKYQIAYLISAEGASNCLENLKALVDELDDGSAIFLIHVESQPASKKLRKAVESWLKERNKSMRLRMKEATNELGNVFLAKVTYPLISGHITKLWSQISGYFELLDLADWDTVINLSIYDYPMRKSREIYLQLTLSNLIGNNLVESWSDHSMS
jgi:hypothetical protein